MTARGLPAVGALLCLVALVGWSLSISAPGSSASVPFGHRARGTRGGSEPRRRRSGTRADHLPWDHHGADNPNTLLIAAVVNREQRAIDHARDVLARHGTNGFPVEACMWDGLPHPCPEIASLHALWCGS